MTPLFSRTMWSSCMAKLCKSRIVSTSLLPSWCLSQLHMCNIVLICWLGRWFNSITSPLFGRYRYKSPQNSAAADYLCSQIVRKCKDVYTPLQVRSKSFDVCLISSVYFVTLSFPEAVHRYYESRRRIRSLNVPFKWERTSERHGPFKRSEG